MYICFHTYSRYAVQTNINNRIERLMVNLLSHCHYFMVCSHSKLSPQVKYNSIHQRHMAVQGTLVCKTNDSVLQINMEQYIYIYTHTHTHTSLHKWHIEGEKTSLQTGCILRTDAPMAWINLLPLICTTDIIQAGRIHLVAYQSNKEHIKSRVCFANAMKLINNAYQGPSGVASAS